MDEEIKQWIQKFYQTFATGHDDPEFNAIAAKFKEKYGESPKRTIGVPDVSWEEDSESSDENENVDQENKSDNEELPINLEDSTCSTASSSVQSLSSVSSTDSDFNDHTLLAIRMKQIKPFVLPSMYAFIANKPPTFLDPIVVSADTNPLAIVSTNKNKLLPTLCGCVLLGDNLFLEMAINSMCFALNPNYPRPISGMCMSGLSIHMAVRKLLKTHFAEGTIVVVNLGTTDLLLGRDTFHMIDEYYKLMQVCDTKRYIMIATTMAPIADVSYNQEHFDQFNKFLKKMPYCIDLFTCMTDKYGSLERKYYEEAPKEIDGAAGPITVWSNKGNRHILSTIDTRLHHYASI